MNDREIKWFYVTLVFIVVCMTVPPYFIVKALKQECPTGLKTPVYNDDHLDLMKPKYKHV